VDEFAHAGLEKGEAETVNCAYVATAPAVLECSLVDIVTQRGEANYLVMGEVTGIHMRDDCLIDGQFDVTTFQPLARLGYRDYTKVETLFSLKRPGEG
jgi:flavin reductase (DIM6/NTAB) family NADH-FMN oxidoreductase RutF